MHRNTNEPYSVYYISQLHLSVSVELTVKESTVVGQYSNVRCQLKRKSITIDITAKYPLVNSMTANITICVYWLILVLEIKRGKILGYH